jgi:hypothetical protein
VKTIWKFPFELSDAAVIEMPQRAKVLHVAAQNGAPTIWALVDTEAPKEPRTFRIVGTGHPIPEDVKHAGTFQQGPFVWHVFEPLTLKDLMEAFL